MPETIRQTLRFALLVALQVLVLNNIHLFGVVCPYLYILFILAFPIVTSPYLTLLVAFALGFSIDVFCNSYGMHTAATVLIAFLRPFVLKLFTSHESDEKLNPSFANIGQNYWLFALVLVLIHHFTLFSLEAFSWSHFGSILLKTVCSTAFTFVLIVCAQLVTFGKKRN